MILILRLKFPDIKSEITIKESVDFIIHAATESSTSLSKDNPLLMRDTIVDGNKNVIEFAVKSNAERLLFVSSGAVYGKNSNISSDLKRMTLINWIFWTH